MTVCPAWVRPRAIFWPQTMISPVAEARRCTRSGSNGGRGGGPAERAPMRLAEARIILGVIAARQGDLEQAVHHEEQALNGPRKSLPSLAMVSRDPNPGAQRQVSHRARCQGLHRPARLDKSAGLTRELMASWPPVAIGEPAPTAGSSPHATPRLSSNLVGMYGLAVALDNHLSK